MGTGFMVKVHGKGRNGVLALCDEELLGKEIVDGEVRFKVTEDFYGGEIAEGPTILRLASVMGSINAIGKRSISLLVDNGLADPSASRLISGVPHIQIYNMFS